MWNGRIGWALTGLASARRRVLIASLGGLDVVAQRAVTQLEEALRTGDSDRLDTAVGLLLLSVDGTPAGEPDRAGRLSNLGVALRTRFEWTGSFADLDAAIRVGEQAAQAASLDDHQRSMYLSNLSTALQHRFDLTGQTSDLDAAVEWASEAAEAAPRDHHDRAVYLSNLGTALRTRYARTGATTDLDHSINARKEAVDLTPVGHRNRAAYLFNLATMLMMRLDRTGDLADLDAAIVLRREATDIAAGSEGDAEYPKYLSNLGAALVTRFGRAGQVADLDAAIEYCENATRIGADHPEQALFQYNLARALNARFDLTDELADLDAMIAASRAAASAGSVPESTLLLFNLGSALRIRFGRTGQLADLDAALDTLRDAVVATPATDPERPMLLSNLGVALRRRFERTGQLADVDEAVAHGQAALATAAPDHPRLAVMHSALANALAARFERTADPADLDNAVRSGQAALDAAPVGDPDRAAFMTALANALLARFEHNGQPADLNEAVHTMRGATDITPEGHAARAGRLNNLGAMLLSRYDLTGQPADLDDAIVSVRAAVDVTPTDHPDLASFLFNLSGMLQRRFAVTSAATDLDGTVEAARQAAGLDAAAPRVRARAATRWGQTAALAQRWDDAVQGYARTIELLEQVVLRGLNRDDQEFLLDQVGGVGADAAACGVRAGDPRRAVELFEHGRGVLLGQTLDLRTDLTALTDQHQHLAERFIALNEELDDGERRATRLAGADPTATDADRPDVARRGEAAALLNRLILDVRELPGFQGFLQPPRLSDLLPAAEQGPIACVAVSSVGSYALIVTTAGVLEPVPLPGVTPGAVHERTIDFLTALSALTDPDGAAAVDQATAEERLTDTLGWLWKTIAEPVLDRLDLNGPPAEGARWPRMWWCPSGLLSFLPLHAAGVHSTRHNPNPSTVMDRVVSSYTPTIRALTHSRRPSPRAAHGGNPAATSGERVERTAGRNIVAVAMPHTPGAADLPGAADEVAVLRQLFPAVRVLAGRDQSDPPIPEPVERAGHDAVVAALAHATWAHLACHGRADLTNPSNSCVLLDDPSEPLVVADVARLRLDQAELVYLSACETARPGGRLTDEAIHLASAFQLAGYRHVIATLWPINDWHSVQLAADVYTALTVTTAAARPDGLEVADALHTASRTLREAWPDDPSLWAAHIHVGA